ncbi:sensor histidine kinase [Psychrobacillus sp. MER TA 171]|uniref:sensor histidine kinase n=1 Tax=Psychrobacillus sp. MER TA 171 TaxID=2939577 RepID=UPI00203DE05B|nr:sensor histidine kinase [Psychrobacillus sp. MER TA 171]MCM3358261.1 sensor histidine kinase [Psychrobacillus sp. MER TA 171]
MKQFLLDRIITIGCLLIAFIFMLIFLVMLEIPTLSIVTLGTFYLLLCGTWLAVNFITIKNKLRRLERLLRQVEQPYLVGEVLPTPYSFTEQQYFDIMRIISQDAISRVEQANREAKEYKEFVEQWIHELKTPLTAMNLVLANDADIRKLRRELKRLNNLTDHILHFARLQSLEKDKQLAPFQLGQLLNQAVKNQMDLLIAAKIRVSVDGEAIIFSDQKALQFIVNQFLINSAKYSPSSQVKMQISEKALVYEDNGIGIPKQELPRIFDRGYTGTNGRNFGTSTGIGLYIVSKMCDELHIRLTVQSEVGQFTRFTLEFPSNLT